MYKTIKARQDEYCDVLLQYHSKIDTFKTFGLILRKGILLSDKDELYICECLELIYRAKLLNLPFDFKDVHYKTDEIDVHIYNHFAYYIIETGYCKLIRSIFLTYSISLYFTNLVNIKILELPNSSYLFPIVSKNGILLRHKYLKICINILKANNETKNLNLLKLKKSF
jgi:hypothetical protein